LDSPRPLGNPSFAVFIVPSTQQRFVFQENVKPDFFEDENFMVRLTTLHSFYEC
jgi:hypothetical protein